MVKYKYEYVHIVVMTAMLPLSGKYARDFIPCGISIGCLRSMKARPAISRKATTEKAQSNTQLREIFQDILDSMQEIINLQYDRQQ